MGADDTKELKVSIVAVLDKFRSGLDKGGSMIKGWAKDIDAKVSSTSIGKSILPALGKVAAAAGTVLSVVGTIATVGLAVFSAVARAAFKFASVLINVVVTAVKAVVSVLEKIVGAVADVLGKVASVGVKVALGVGAAIGAALFMGVKRNFSEMQLQAIFKRRLGGAWTGAWAEVERLAARGGRFGISELADAMVLLSRTDLKRPEQYLQDIVDTANGAGASLEEVADMFVRITTKGEEGGLGRLAMMLQRFGITRAQASGIKSAADLAEVLRRKFGGIAAEMDRLDPMGEIWRNMKDGVRDLTRPLAESLLPVLNRIAERMEAMRQTPAFKDMAKRIGEVGGAVARFLDEKVVALYEYLTTRDWSGWIANIPLGLKNLGLKLLDLRKLFVEEINGKLFKGPVTQAILGGLEWLWINVEAWFKRQALPWIANAALEAVAVLIDAVVAGLTKAMTGGGPMAKVFQVMFGTKTLGLMGAGHLAARGVRSLKTAPQAFGLTPEEQWRANRAANEMRIGANRAGYTMQQFWGAGGTQTEHQGLRQALQNLAPRGAGPADLSKLPPAPLPSLTGMPGYAQAMASIRAQEKYAGRYPEAASGQRAAQYADAMRAAVDTLTRTILADRQVTLDEKRVLAKFGPALGAYGMGGRLQLNTGLGPPVEVHLTVNGMIDEAFLRKTLIPMIERAVANAPRTPRGG